MQQQNVHDPGSGSVTQGHPEKWVQKSCVSFEEECIYDNEMISQPGTP